jgi:thiamine biosynthesis lipoprotein
MTADAFATAFILLGSEKAIALANQRNLAVYLIKKDGEKYIELMSSKLLNYLEI